ncbi:uncharacterized protein J4E92_004051 [Alternaria infectoria]|uniref:uncharacterized protein n=1 Tax=Alternaria infectoria TaxID=45303 RepID=UPI00221EE1B5|nr:uncharacterized protein J4E92_004051 [Alternaria infectoria]KAI4932152.1 hypothetical protein J4E92_004051 [Alternaria infectoria]
MDNACDELLARTKALLSSGDYSDLIITCGSDVYNVHKAVVCPQSSFFERAVRFAVGKEAAEGKVDLPEDDLHVVKLLVQYFYECEYSPELNELIRTFESAKMPITNRQPGYHYLFPHTCEPGCPPPHHSVCQHHTCVGETCKEKCVNFICKQCIKTQLSEGDAAQLLLHAMMYEVADKYDIPGLSVLAKEKFARSCEACWDTEGFVTAAEHALTTTPDSDTGLRESLYQTVVGNIELLNKPAIATLLSEHAAFAHGVLRRLAEEKAGLKAMAKTAS